MEKTDSTSIFIESCCLLWVMPMLKIWRMEMYSTLSTVIHSASWLALWSIHIISVHAMPSVYTVRLYRSDYTISTCKTIQRFMNGKLDTRFVRRLLFLVIFGERSRSGTTHHSAEDIFFNWIRKTCIELAFAQIHLTTKIHARGAFLKLVFNWSWHGFHLQRYEWIDSIELRREHCACVFDAQKIFVKLARPFDCQATATVTANWPSA